MKKQENEWLKQNFKIKEKNLYVLKSALEINFNKERVHLKVFIFK